MDLLDRIRVLKQKRNVIDDAIGKEDSRLKKLKDTAMKQKQIEKMMKQKAQV